MTELAPSAAEPAPQPSAARQVRTVLWLQRRLLRNALRLRRGRSIGQIVSLGVIGVVALPSVIVYAVILTLALHESPPDVREQILTVVYTLAVVLWLSSPASGQQLLDNPQPTRLLVHPIALPALVASGVLTSSLSLIALFTLPFLLATVIGSARAPADTIAIAVSCAAVFGVLVMVRTLTNDVFDLVAEDRRSRNRLTLLVVVPLMVLYVTQFGLQGVGRQDAAPFANFLAVARHLRWLPPGWFASAVRAAHDGRAAAWLAGTAALAALSVGGAWVHYRLQARLYLGELVRGGPAATGRARALRDRRRLPGLSAGDSAVLRALLAKDWRNLRRSPMTPRMAFVPIMFAFMSFFFTRNTASPPLLVGLGAGSVAAFSVTSLSVNALAVLDHRGLGALLLSPVSRRLVLFSHGLLEVGLAGMIGTVLGVVVGVAGAGVTAAIAAPLSAMLAQVCFSGLAHLSSVLMPYHVDLERGRSSANESTLLVVIVLMIGMPLAAAPAYLVLVLAGVLAPAWLPAAIVAALTYAVTLYGVLLALAGRAFRAREERLLREIVEDR